MWVLAPILMALRKPYILTIHSGHFVNRFAKFSMLKRYFIRDLIDRCFAVIFVSDEIRSYVECQVVRPKRALVVPAFIAPVRPKVPHRQVQRLREVFSKIVLICGFPLPEYGFDGFIEAAQALRKERGIAFVLVLYPTADSASRDKYRDVESAVRQRISMFAAQAADVLVLEAMTPEELSAVQVGCDIFVRNTSVDGDSVALREAAYLGCQVVASDAVSRPPGTLIFRTHDVSDLERAIRNAVNDEARGRLDCPSQDGVKKIIDLYWDGIGRSKSRITPGGGD
jgi:glycosyltransferase involved in cell wall biosynthesis